MKTEALILLLDGDVEALRKAWPKFERHSDPFVLEAFSNVWTRLTSEPLPDKLPPVVEQPEYFS